MANITSSSAEKGLTTLKAVETSRLIVRQPGKLQELTSLLETFENLSARVSERTGEDRSGDMGGAGTGVAGTQGVQGTSARDLAIKNIPAPAIMQQKLATHIRKETIKLERLARAVARSSAPGSAHKLNALYAKIRRLNAMIHDMLEASVEILKRLFIRVFIDNQPIL